MPLPLRDRFRTAVNVWGDSIGAGILDHIFRNFFKEPAGEATAVTDGADLAGSRPSVKKEKLIGNVDDATANGELTNPAFETKVDTKL